MPEDNSYSLVQNGDVVRPTNRTARFLGQISGANTGITWLRNLSHGAGSMLTSTDPRVKMSQTILLHVGTLCSYGLLPPIQFANLVKSDKLANEIKTIEVLITQLAAQGEPEDTVADLKATLNELKTQASQYQISLKEYILFGFWTVCAGMMIAQCVQLLKSAPAQHLDLSRIENWQGLIFFVGILLAPVLLNLLHEEKDLGQVEARLSAQHLEVLKLIDQAKHELAPLEASTERLQALESRTNRFLRRHRHATQAIEDFLKEEQKLHLKMLTLKEEVEEVVTIINEKTSSPFEKLRNEIVSIVRDGTKQAFLFFYNGEIEQTDESEGVSKKQASENKVDIELLIQKINEKFNRTMKLLETKKPKANTNNNRMIFQGQYEKLILQLEDWFSENKSDLELLKTNLQAVQTQCDELNEEKALLQERLFTFGTLDNCQLLTLPLNSSAIAVMSGKIELCDLAFIKENSEPDLAIRLG
jgi:hypothetical protein